MRIVSEEILYQCFQIHFVCPTAGWWREMYWVNLLREKAIIALAVCWVVRFFSLKREGKSGPAESRSLIEEAEAAERSSLSPVFPDYWTVVLNSRLSRQGDSARITGSDEEFVQGDYRYGKFSSDYLKGGVTYSSNFPSSHVTVRKRNSEKLPVEWIDAGSSNRSSFDSNASSGDTTIAVSDRLTSQPMSKDSGRKTTGPVDICTSSGE